MAKSKETFNKKAKQQQKVKKRNDKLVKREERKANSNKGKSLDDMIAYVDEDGNITNTPPDPRNRKVVNAEDIIIQIPEGNFRNTTRTGVLEFYNTEKGYGFIIDKKSREKFFVHNSNMLEPLAITDKVMFDTEKSMKGATAINVKKLV
ncbi:MULTISPECIES: cold shock domain-containing protein [unclassified Paraflavitalea]|uniref:cold shock domain-containing protein n=1 Tax=unclassified Paraflavitalea TaxID=2798305 RepID=UPI003D3384BC